MGRLKKLSGFFLVMALFFLKACNCAPSSKNIRLDGSSTVYVISEAVAEEFQKNNHERLSIGISGTGGGFKKLCSGRIDIIGASRAIKESEKNTCQKNGIAPQEFAVALDGIVVAVNPNNKWLSEISISQLKKIFEPEAEGKINRWSDLDQSFPNEEMDIFAPGISSGTYDYFTKAVVGKEHASRGDITTSEDDNVLVHGVYSNEHSIGFFSFAYYLENQHKLKALSIKNDKNPDAKAVFPTQENIKNGLYTPLSRPVFIYTDVKKLNPHSLKFLEYYLQNCTKLAQDVGFIALSQDFHEQNLQKLKRAINE